MPCCCITLHQRSRDTGATFSWLPASGCHAYCSQLRFSRGRAFARQPPASLVIVYDCCGCGSGRQWPCTAEDQHACRECRSRRRLVAWRCEPGMQRATEPTSAHDESAADGDARCSCRSVCAVWIVARGGHIDRNDLTLNLFLYKPAYRGDHTPARRHRSHRTACVVSAAPARVRAHILTPPSLRTHISVTHDTITHLARLAVHNCSNHTQLLQSYIRQRRFS